jgi:hypothetical protein
MKNKKGINKNTREHEWLKNIVKECGSKRVLESIEEMRGLANREKNNYIIGPKIKDTVSCLCVERKIDECPFCLGTKRLVKAVKHVIRSYEFNLEDDFEDIYSYVGELKRYNEIG